MQTPGSEPHKARQKRLSILSIGVVALALLAIGRTGAVLVRDRFAVKATPASGVLPAQTGGHEDGPTATAKPPDSELVVLADLSGPPPSSGVADRLQWLLDRLPPPTPGEPEDLSRQRKLFRQLLDAARSQPERKEIDPDEMAKIVQARAVLEGKFRDGTASPIECRFLAGLCRLQGDTGCGHFVKGGEQ